MAGSALDTVPTDDTSARLVDQLLADQWITSPAVRAAFHRVPRHLFAADGISLGRRLRQRRNHHQPRPGRARDEFDLRAVLQAAMLHAAHLQLGARVLEVGSGGYNAALIADIFGPGGTVATVDIDAAVIDRTRTTLDRAGPRQVTSRMVYAVTRRR
ncbi:hypothetical protein ACFWDK_09265 [Micromonospora chalcea]